MKKIILVSVLFLLPVSAQLIKSYYSSGLVSGGGGGGSGPTLQTNGTNNSSQTTLNLVSGTTINGIGITVTNTSGGTVQLNPGFAGQANHTFFAGPISGGPGNPNWRITDITDLPSTLFTLTTIGSSGAATYTPGTPGTLNIPSYTGGGGSLPSFVANLYLTNNGSAASWGDILTGPTGGLCSGTACSGGTPGKIDIDPTVVATKLAGTNTFTNSNDFSATPWVKPMTIGSTAPPCAAIPGDIGNTWEDTTSSVTSHLKICSVVSSAAAFVTVY